MEGMHTQLWWIHKAARMVFDGRPCHAWPVYDRDSGESPVAVVMVTEELMDGMMLSDEGADILVKMAVHSCGSETVERLLANGGGCMNRHLGMQMNFMPGTRAFSRFRKWIDDVRMCRFYRRFVRFVDVDGLDLRTLEDAEKAARWVLDRMPGVKDMPESEKERHAGIIAKEMVDGD